MFKHEILSVIKRPFTKSHYTKMLIFYSFFTLIVIAFSAFILINHFINILTNETKLSNQKLLNQISIYSDTVLDKNIYSMVNENFLSFRYDASILGFFSPGRLNDDSALYGIYDSLNKIVTASSIIDSIYVYRLYDDMLVSSREGVFYSVMEPKNSMSKYVNIKLIKDTMSSKSKNRWVSPLENIKIFNKKNIFGENQPIISFVQSVPIMTQENNKTGYVVININEKRLYNSVKHISDTNPGKLIVMDTHGNVFFSSNEDELSKTISMNGYLKDAFQRNTGLKISRLTDGYYCIAWNWSKSNNWVYILVTPLKVLNSELLLARKIAVAFTLCIALLALMSIRFITFRLYSPIRLLFRSTTEKFNIQDRNANELDVINNVIQTLSIRVDEMQDMIRNNQGVIRYRLVMDIINGNIKDKDEIRERLELIGEQFPYRGFYILLTELDVCSMNLLSHEQREYIVYKMIDVIDSYFCSGCNRISVSLNPRRIMSILNFECSEYVQGKLQTLIQQIKVQTSLSCNMALSSETDNILDISGFYEPVEALLKYSFIYGYGNIFFQHVTAGFKENDKSFDFLPLDSITGLLNSCKIPAVKEKITQIFVQLKKGNYSFEHIQNVLFQLFNIISRVIKEQKIDVGIDRNSLYAEFNSITSLDECQQWVFSLVDTYEKNVSMRNTLIDTTFTDRITAYICENVECGLSLNSVAEEFKITSNYLSKIFKEGTGTNFSNFLLQKKLEKARELLLSDKKITVIEIGNMLGYYNTAYFISLFKENYGITPAMFRKKNLGPVPGNVEPL